MKKAGITLVIITLLFFAFACGFFIGRNANHSHVQVGSYQLPTSSNETETTTSGNTAVVNINTADVSELATLPGVGTTLAQRIIDYRIANGPFSDELEIANVSGIGEKRLKELLQFITVGG